MAISRRGIGTTLLVAILLADIGCSESLPPGSPTGDRLAFSRQPTHFVAGALIAPSISVAVTDSAGRIDKSSSVAITIAIANGASGAILGGTTTRTVVDGTATFDDLTIEKARTGLALTATATQLKSATSSAFDVRAGAPREVAFADHPRPSMVGAEMEPVRVAVLDAYGNSVLAAVVTIGLSGNPEGVVLGGTHSRLVIDGIANFDDLTVDRVGTYSLTASSASLTTAPSAEFTVTPATIILARAAPDSQGVFPAQQLRDPLRVRLTDDRGVPIPGQLVRWTISAGTGTLTPDTSRTDAAGEARASWTLPTSLGATGTVTARAAGFRVDFRATVSLGDWNWRKIELPFGEKRVTSVLVDPSDDRVWYIWGIATPMFVTHDAGGTWTTATFGSGINAKAVSIDPADPRRVFAAAGRTLHVSTDKGLSWTLLATFGEDNRSIHVSPRDGAIYFAPQWPVAQESPTVAPGIYRSTDGGASFQHLPYGMPLGTAVLTWDIEEHPGTGALFLVNEIADHPLPYHPPVLRSQDRGVTWQNVAPTDWWHSTSMQTDPRDGSLYVLLEGPGLWKSSDGGARWTKISSQPGVELHVDAAHPNRLFVGNVAFGIVRGGAFISADGGGMFWPLGFDGRTVTGFALNHSGTTMHLVALNDGLYVSPVPGVVP